MELFASQWIFLENKLSVQFNSVRHLQLAIFQPQQVEAPAIQCWWRLPLHKNCFGGYWRPLERLVKEMVPGRKNEGFGGCAQATWWNMSGAQSHRIHLHLNFGIRLYVCGGEGLGFMKPSPSRSPSEMAMVTEHCPNKCTEKRRFQTVGIPSIFNSEGQWCWR